MTKMPVATITELSKDGPPSGRRLTDQRDGS